MRKGKVNIYVGSTSERKEGGAPPLVDGLTFHVQAIRGAFCKCLK